PSKYAERPGTDIQGSITCHKQGSCVFGVGDVGFHFLYWCEPNSIKAVRLKFSPHPDVTVLGLRNALWSSFKAAFSHSPRNMRILSDRGSGPQSEALQASHQRRCCDEGKTLQCVPTGYEPSGLRNSTVGATCHGTGLAGDPAAALPPAASSIVQRLDLFTCIKVQDEDRRI